VRIRVEAIIADHHLRDEGSCNWAKRLELNPRADFKDGLTYMPETGNTALPVYEQVPAGQQYIETSPALLYNECVLPTRGVNI
jgi:hypothetical protein